MARRPWLAVLVLLASEAGFAAFLRSRALPNADCASCPAPAFPEPVPPRGHERLGPPQPGEWRALNPEETAQSFEAYAASGPNRRCAHRRTIYLLPFETKADRRSLAPGAHERFLRTLPLMREHAERFFGVPATLLPPEPMPENAWNRERGQSSADRILSLLAARLPADALALVGVTEDDLYSGRLNFVFGLGSLRERAGVYSLRRFSTPDEALFLRRALKLLAHETGHLFSIPHCTECRCLMQGANSLPEHDAHPLRLCPGDLRKLEWACGVDRKERWRRLEEFYRGNGLVDEADWTAARLKK
jgi:archaemetzincin